MKVDDLLKLDCLESWEKSLNSKFSQVKKKNTAGYFLSVIPEHDKWDEFLELVKNEWDTWKKDLSAYPTCLLTFLCGVAYYEYEDNTFWPNIAKSIGQKKLSQWEEKIIKENLQIVSKKLGLKLIKKNNRTNYVGSVIHFIAIPLSMWENFLELCEWCSWQDDLYVIPDVEWNRAVKRYAGSRQRIKKFLIENRDIVIEFVKEMLDAREIIKKDSDLTIDDIAQLCHLRNEYFDEVPETSEFLSPQNSDVLYDSLFRNIPKLIWNDYSCQLNFFLPSVNHDQFPAEWCLGPLTQKAATTPDEMVVNSKAFNKNLILELNFNNGKNQRRIKGVEPFALFDLGRNGRMVNLRRNVLPISNYVIVAPQKIEILSKEGFEDKEIYDNELIELRDGGHCYVTRFWPNKKFASVHLQSNNRQYKLKFRTRLKIESYFFAGINNQAANFTRLDDKVKIEHLPELCVTIPTDYFKENKLELDRKFKVYVDHNQAPGRWEEKATRIDNDKELYKWRWDGPPLIEKIESKTGRLQDLTYKTPDLRGDRTISINSFNFSSDYKVFLEHSRHGMGHCWRNLPGAYILWFVLCQSKDGLKWEDLMLVKDIIAPNQRIFYYMLRKYAEQELIIQHGRLWKIDETRIVLKSNDDVLNIDFCGDPSILWGLYRCMSYDHNCNLPVIEVVEKRGELPYLNMNWKLNLKQSSKLVGYLKKCDVKIRKKLWIH